MDVLAKALFLSCLGVLLVQGTYTQLFHRPLEGRGFPGLREDLWGFSIFSETGCQKEWSLMGVLFCCVFFVKCRQRKPKSLELKPWGPQSLVGLLLTAGTHTPCPWLQPCVCRCPHWALWSWRGGLRNNSDHGLRVRPGGPGSASGTFRTPVTINGSYAHHLDFPSSRMWWEELCVWKAMSGIH